MDELGRGVLVDTYGIMADLVGEAPPLASAVLERIRLGEVVGIIHYLILFELAYHWRKGRLPFKDENELLEFTKTYFKTMKINEDIALEASKIKLEGDIFLKKSNNPKLKRRKLSISDAITIALARKLGISILSGDADLIYVARKLKVNTIW